MYNTDSGQPDSPSGFKPENAKRISIYHTDMGEHGESPLIHRLASCSSTHCADHYYRRIEVL